MIGQEPGKDWNCFPIAAINACVWKGVEPPALDALIEIAGC